jgi:hypothetical protein
MQFFSPTFEVALNVGTFGCVGQNYLLKWSIYRRSLPDLLVDE